MMKNTWLKICALEDIPVLGARVVRRSEGDIAVFRNGENEVFALRDKCPHKGGPLSQGIIFGKRVACPLHNCAINLDDGSVWGAQLIYVFISLHVNLLRQLQRRSSG